MWELSLLGISHALFGFILLSLKEDKNKSDFLLIIWILILLQPFINEFITSLRGSQWTSVGFNNQAFTLLNGPILYLYIREIIKKEKSSRIIHWPHFIPFAFFYLIFFINPAPFRPGGPGQNPGQMSYLLKQFGLINVAIFLIYGILSLLLLFSHSKEFKEIFAYKNRKNTLYFPAITASHPLDENLAQNLFDGSRMAGNKMVSSLLTPRSTNSEGDFYSDISGDEEGDISFLVSHIYLGGTYTLLEAGQFSLSLSIGGSWFLLLSLD